MKKLSSLLMALIMISMMMSAPGVCPAADNSSEEVIEFPIVEDTVLYSDNSDKTGGYGEEIFGDDTELMLRSRPNRSTARSKLLTKTAALEGIEEKLVPGKGITKVEFCTYLANGSYDIKTDVKFFPTDANVWDESTINMITWCSNAYSPVLIWNGDGIYGEFDSSAVPSAVHNYSFPKVGTEDTNPMVTFDITKVFNDAFPQGVKNTDAFSMLVAFEENTSTYNYGLFASSEAQGLEPYIKVTIGDVAPMIAESVTLPEIEGESFTLTTSNNIKSAVVKVNGEVLEGDAFEFSGTRLVINDIWKRLTTYKVEVDATDIYNQKMQKQTHYFTIGYGVSKQKASCTDAYSIKRDGAATKVESSDVWTSSGESLSANVYRFPLPEISGNKHLASYEISYWSSYPANDISIYNGIYKWDPELGYDFADMTFGDIAHLATGDNAHGISTFVKNDGGKILYTIDVTEEAKRLAESGEAYICVMIMPSLANSSLKLYGSSGTYGAYSQYSVSDVEEILCYDKSVNISGNVLTEANFLFTTSFDEAVASDISIIKDYGSRDATEIQDVAFAYDNSDSSISLSDAVTLDADSMYTIVLKAGAQDNFSNVLENDLILAHCYASDTPAVSSVKIMDSGFDDYANYESAVAIESLSDADYVKPVCKINNQSDSNENILIFAASYDSEGALTGLSVSVVEAVAQTEDIYAGNSLEITDSCAQVKAFVWSAANYTVLTKTVTASK